MFVVLDASQQKGGVVRYYVDAARSVAAGGAAAGGAAAGGAAALGAHWFVAAVFYNSCFVFGYHNYVCIYYIIRINTACLHL
jgi:hypothetical protein